MAGDSKPTEGNDQLAFKRAERQVLRSKDAQEARNAGAKDVAGIEAKRTNKSSGSLAEEQNHSIEIVTPGAVSSRKNRLTEKDLAKLEARKRSISDDELSQKASKGDGFARDLLGQMQKAKATAADGQAALHRVQEVADRFYGRGEFAEKQARPATTTLAGQKADTAALKAILADDKVPNDRRFLVAQYQEMREKSKACGYPTDEIDKAAGSELATELRATSNRKQTPLHSHAEINVSLIEAKEIANQVQSLIEPNYQAELAKCGPAIITGAEQGVKELANTGIAITGIASDAASVMLDTAQIASQQLNNPALAEANADYLGEKLRELGAKYKPLAQSAERVLTGIEANLEDIGAEGQKNPTAYERLVTDPANFALKQYESFSNQ